MNRILVWGIVYVLSLGIALPCHAAGKKKAAGKASSTIERPFDMDSTVVKHTQFNSEIALFHDISKKRSMFTKSEYETTDQYMGRLQLLDTQFASGKVRFGDPVAISILRGLNMTYDADAAELVVTAESETVSDPEIESVLEYKKAGEYLSTYPVSYKTFIHKFMEKKFTGENGFGVKIRAVAQGYSSYAVAMRGGSDTSSIRIAVPMTPAEAIQAKTWGGVIVVGKLAFPYVGTSESHSAATIDNPYDVYERIQYLVIDPSEIWFLHRRNGKIYKKIKLDNPQLTQEETEKTGETL